jgi:hypothetical protein
MKPLRQSEPIRFLPGSDVSLFRATNDIRGTEISGVGSRNSEGLPSAAVP